MNPFVFVVNVIVRVGRISVRTVTTHIANIFSKLGVSSRGELADRLRDSAELAPAPQR